MMIFYSYVKLPEGKQQKESKNVKKQTRHKSPR